MLEWRSRRGQAGAFATTDSYGQFRIPGPLSGAISVRASKEGYLTATQKTQGPHYNLVFRLEATGPSVDITGAYTLTLLADSTCTALPDVLEASQETGGTGQLQYVPLGPSGKPSQYVNAPPNEPELLDPFTDASTHPQISTVEDPNSSVNPLPYSPPIKSLAVLPLTPMSKRKSFDR